ncbi:hypothetical protein NEIRO03_0590 [Nematocida sp. AWRm78]|nr:hypothetical protein NEIRO02_0545 [Nematocida sp. AWRm79]KAI5182955.1 hypothetical protein NEIRO03_0590 [Nematocida sp. AWRm78]
MRGGQKPRQERESTTKSRAHAISNELLMDKEFAENINKNNMRNKPSIPVEASEKREKKIQEIINRLERSKYLNHTEEAPVERNSTTRNQRRNSNGFSTSSKERSDRECPVKSKQKKTNEVRAGSSLILPIRSANPQPIDPTHHTFNQLIESSPVINQMKNILEGITTLLNAKTLGEAQKEETPKMLVKSEKTAEIFENGMSSYDESLERELLQEKQDIYPEVVYEEILENNFYQPNMSYNTEIPAKREKERKRKRLTQEKAQLCLEEMTRREISRRNNQYLFYRISNMPPINCAIAKLQQIWCTIADLRLIDLGMIVMLDKTEAQFIISQKSIKKLDLIIESYMKLNSEVILTGPLKDPLDHKNYTKELVLDLIKERSAKVLQNTKNEACSIYRFCKKIKDCTSVKDFHNKVHTYS